MEADSKLTVAEVRPFACSIPHTQGKEEPIMDKENTTRSVALRNDQISQNDFLILAAKAKEMIENNSTPPPPKNKVRQGKRVRVKI